MEEKKKKIIFILGHARSGTTLLNRILNEHPDIHFINYEFNDLPYFYEREYKYNKYGERKYEVMANDILNHPGLRNTLPNNIQIKHCHSFRVMIDQIFDAYRIYNNKIIIGVKVVERIKENIRFILDEFTDSYCIHIIRDPRDVFLSLKKMHFQTRSPFYAGKSWSYVINNINLLQRSISNFYEIKYENLIINPSTELSKVCNFLKIDPYIEEMLNFYLSERQDWNNILDHLVLLKEPLNKANMNKWKHKLSSKEINLVQQGSHIEIVKNNYTTNLSNDISLVQRLYQYFFDKIFKFMSSLRHPKQFLLYRILPKIYLLNISKSFK